MAHDSILDEGTGGAAAASCACSDGVDTLAVVAPYGELAAFTDRAGACGPPVSFWPRHKAQRDVGPSRSTHPLLEMGLSVQVAVSNESARLAVAQDRLLCGGHCDVVPIVANHT